MTGIIKAIKAINPSAEVSINADDINQITWLNGTAVISKADIEAKLAELPTAEEEATAKANNKTSAQNKLKALGLTDAEIEAL